MSRLTGKVSRRIMAFVLSLAMIMPNMTAYAGELNMPQAEVQTDIDTDTDGVTVDVTEDSEDTSGASEDDNAEPEEGDINNSDDDADAEDETSDLDEEESDNSDEAFEVEAEKPLKDTSSGEQTETVEHIVNATTLSTHLVENSGDTIKADTLLSDYFTTVGNVMQCWDDSTNGDYLRVQSKSRGAIQFTVTGSATLEIEAGCVNNSASTYIILADPADDEYKKLDKTSCTATTFPNDENKDTVEDRAKQKRTWSNLGEGTYVICTNGIEDAPRSKDLRVYSIKVIETIVARGDWEAVADPTITAEKDATNNSKINVTVTADVSDNGGDKVEVEMYKGSTATGTPQETQVSREETTTHTFTFSPDESGTYCFKAKLSRANKPDDVKTNTTGPITIAVPLTTPENLSVTEQISDEGLVSVTLSWDAVKAADHYEIVVKDKNAATDATPVYKNENVSKETTSVAINSGIGRGKTYTFSVSAVRTGTEEGGVDETTTATINKKISSNEIVTKDYFFSPIEFEDISTGEIANGTIFGTDVYFKAAILHKDGTIQNEGQFVRIRQKGQAGIQFTVEGTADVVISAASTGGNNTSWVALWDNGKNEAVAEKDNKKSVYGTTASTLTYKGVTAGTYTVLSPNDGGDGNRDIRLHSITVTETSNRSERMEFDSVNKPVVKSVTEGQDGEISVEVTNALLGYDGGDRLLVVLEDENGKEISGIKGVSALPGSTHTVMLNISSCETGNYTVRANLVRGVGEDKQELKGDITQSLNHIQDLKNPENLYVTNKGQKEEGGSGSVWLSWKAAYGAKYYIIEVIDGSNETRTIKTTNANTSYLIDDGLTVGSKYTFKVYGTREVDNVE
ncbi:MAG: hypothetical protein HDR29_03920, partial [Lachnospiraceae bacterium]|nr:hypothetical protein [Lachnospiraceae bacterium]